MAKSSEKIGRCSGCGFRLYLAKLRGRWLCRQCLMVDEVPARVEDYTAYSSPLALAAEMVDDTALGYGVTGDFKKALDRALAKYGLAITAADSKAMMFAGADDGRAAKRARWKAEDREEDGSGIEITVPT